MGFLKENWVWIVAPVVLVAVAFIAILVMQDGSDTGVFVYRIY